MLERRRKGGDEQRQEAQREHFYSAWNKEKGGWGFTHAQREALSHEGKTFYWLTGQELGTLIKKHAAANNVFELDERSPAWRTRSLRAEVAFDPDGGILKGSAGKTLEEQLIQIQTLSHRKAQQIPGTRAIIGELADHLELGALLSREGKSPFTGEYYSESMISNFPFPYYIRTGTVVGSLDMGLIGGNGPFTLSSWSYLRGEKFIVTHPLIVNAAAV